MLKTFARVATVLVLSGALSFTVSAQTAPQAPAAPAAPAAAAAPVTPPTYTSILMETTVNRPAAAVWARVGKYCDIGEWLRVNCTMLSGRDGEVGAVRSVVNEVLVGRTEFSYTYTQPVVPGRPYNLYHGTLEVRPVTATTSRIIYTLMWDNSMLADDEARERDRMNRRTRFQQAVDNMKILAEGGTLPPAPPRQGGAAPAPAQPAGRN